MRKEIVLVSLLMIVFIPAGFLNNTCFSFSLNSKRPDISNKQSQTIAYFTNKTFIEFSTFFGGIEEDNGHSIASDYLGNSYVTGSTQSNDFPTKNAYNASHSGKNGSSDAFLAKFNSTGGLAFSTYFGGSNNDSSYGIAVDTVGDSYITGTTFSSDFPIKNAYDSNYKGGSKSSDIFISKFSSTGDLEFSTYFGGSSDDHSNSIAVDENGNCYITGYTRSSDFPIKNAINSTFNGGRDAFIAKFSSNGTLIFSSYLGGENNDQGYSVATDMFDDSFITGVTSSKNFPLKNNYFPFRGTTDGFVCKINSTGSLIFSTYLGGNSTDKGLAISVSNNGTIYVTGTTNSPDFPIYGTGDSSFGGFSDSFLSIFNPNGKIKYSSYLGGSGIDVGKGIKIDSSGKIYITGITSSTNFPLKNAVEMYSPGNKYLVLFNTFITVFNSYQNILFSTYLGGFDNDTANGIDVDKQGNFYLIGTTSSSDFPTKIAFSAIHGGIPYNLKGDAYITKFLSGILLQSVNSPVSNSFSTSTTSSTIMTSSSSSKSSSSTTNLISMTGSTIQNLISLDSTILVEIISSMIFSGFLMLSLVIIYEYRSYSKFKGQKKYQSIHSFKQFLKFKLRRNSSAQKHRKHISDETLEILDKILQENKNN